MATRAGPDRATAEMPVLEAIHVRGSALVALPPPALRASRTSSSHSSQSSSSGSRRRFGLGRQPPPLRRLHTQDSDPCMLGASFEGWSDDEEEQKENDGDTHRARPPAPVRPLMQRSHTERAATATGMPPAAGRATIAAAPPVAPLIIRVRKFASSPALDVTMLSPALEITTLSPAKRLPFTSSPLPQDIEADLPSASISSLPPMLTDSFDQINTELTSVLEEGASPGNGEATRDRVDEMLRPGRFASDQLTDPNRHSTLPYAANEPPPASPRVGRMGWLFAWTANPRFRRWYGRILNSYFAFWLVVCSLAVALIQLILLLVAVFLDSGTREAASPSRNACHKLGLQSLHYFGGVACVTLVLPVVFPIRAFALYHKRDADRRMVRLPYLLLCELFVTIEVGYLVYFIFYEGYRLPKTIECHRDMNLSDMRFLYGTLLLWGVLWWQLVVFCRFLVHLKLQADAANESTHTSALSDWLRVSNTRELAASKAGRPIQRFKKLLYRAAATGDTDAVNDLLEPSSLEFLGIDGPDSVRSLYATGPTLWLFAFAVSCKNPLHIAAKRGHVAIVDKLLSIGFDANALDKVARVNFNVGLLYKLATRLLLLPTQDGAKALLRPVLCSVLLPPLHGAVAAGHVDVVRVLLEKGGADPNALPRASFYHPSAVIPAIFLADDPEIVKLLVAKGANFLHVARTTLSGWASSTYATALQRSALTQRSATTEYLLSCGGDVALTPLHAAAADDNVRTVTRLLRRRGGRGRGGRGGRGGDRSQQRRADADDRTNSHVDARGERVEGVQRRTPLHWAAVVGRAASATVLLEGGADPDARDRYGRTPLHWAAHNNHTHVVALLLAHGADAQAEDDAGVPVLSFAAESEGVEPRVIAALLERGASLKHTLPGSGDTPLHIALLRENRATATSLIRCGADLMAVNNDGKRAVDVTTSTRLQFELKKEAGTRDIMISYPHSHFAFAQRVREYLEEEGKLTCWMDTMDPSGIGGGAVWREEIARGIHNCSLVVSIVCGGYTTSEWCLKELALAKMIRKPVIALLVEPPVESVPASLSYHDEGDEDDDHDQEQDEKDVTDLSPLDALVPKDHQLPFHAFVRGTRILDKGVELDVDDAALATAWRAVLPRLKNAMQTPEHAGGRWLKSESTSSSTFSSSGMGIGSAGTGMGTSTNTGHDTSSRGRGSGLFRRTESDLDGHDAVGGDSPLANNGDDAAPTLATHDTQASLAASLGLHGARDDKPMVSVAVFSTIALSVFRERLVVDISSQGFRAHALDVAASDTDAQLTHQLTTVRVLIVVVESLGAEVSREQRHDAGAQLTRLLRVAAGMTNGPRVCPVVARDEFLSFSNLYTLARSELLYFVSGAGERQSTQALLRQLRRAAADPK